MSGFSFPSRDHPRGHQIQATPPAPLGAKFPGFLSSWKSSAAPLVTSIGSPQRFEPLRQSSMAIIPDDRRPAQT